MFRALRVFPVLAFLAAVSASATFPAGAAELQQAQAPVMAVPSLGAPSCAPGVAVPFHLLLRNRSDDIRLAKKPEAADFAFKVQGPAGSEYAAVLKPTGRGEAGTGDVWLKPGCSIDVTVGSIAITRAGLKREPVPIGQYLLTVSWTPKAVENVATGELATRLVLEVNEYPFQVSLVPEQRVFPQGQPVLLTVRMANNGKMPIRLLNFFSPYKAYFELAIRRTDGQGREPEGELFIKPAVTPDADTGWVTLMPGEALEVRFDAGDDLKEPGEYGLTAAYAEAIVLLPANERPRDSTQSEWRSAEVKISVRKGN